jgi:hypothetical protein
VRSEEPFTLLYTNDGAWRFTEQPWPVDTGLAEDFVHRLAELRIVQFVKDVVTEPDLPAYGLASPQRRYLLREGPASVSNGPPLELGFGLLAEDKVFVRRSDENPVYAVLASDFSLLPMTAWQLRDRAIWQFTPAQVASLSLRRNDAVWQLLRQGTNQWSLAPGSQGIINDFAIEETTHRLGTLRAVAWVARGCPNGAVYGLTDDAPGLSVELKDGSRRTLSLGFPAPSGHLYARTELQGEAWVFEFPVDIADLVRSHVVKPSPFR